MSFVIGLETKWRSRLKEIIYQARFCERGLGWTVKHSC